VYYILDEFTVRPGRLADVEARVEHGYVPGARARGMTLVHRLASTVERHDTPNELLYLWSVPDAASYWAMRSQANRDPLVATFWAELDADLVRRTRRVLGDELPGTREVGA
jgi:hypothetical protein